MANVLFNNKTYTIDELDRKYAQFKTPTMEIYIDGTELIQQESIAVTELMVETTVDFLADSFSFQVANAFNLVKNDFEEKWIKKYFSPGKYVEIKLGYVDKVESVFYGLITSVTFEYPEDMAPLLTVKGMDPSFLMMKGNHSETWLDQKHSDVVKKIAQKYGLKAEVDETTVKKSIITQNDTNDFRFVAWLAEQNHYDFFVVGKTLYFRKPQKDKTPVLTLKWGYSLKSYSAEVDLSQQVAELTVIGFDEKESKTLEGKASSIKKIGNNSSTGQDLMKKLGSKNVEYIYSNGETQEEVQDIADAALNRRGMLLVKGHGECWGIPEMRAGRYVKFENLGKKMNELVYLTAVTHFVGNDGYTIRFQTGGNAI